MKKITKILIVLGLLIISVVGYFKIKSAIEKKRFEKFIEKNKKVANVPGRILTYSDRIDENTKKQELASFITKGSKTTYFTDGRLRFCLNGTTTLGIGDNSFGIFDLSNNLTKKIPFPKEYTPFNFDMSPDGKTIIFSGSIKENYVEIYSLDIKTGKIIDLTKNMNARYPRFSYNGEKITFFASASKKSEYPKTIYTMDADGKNINQILEGRIAGGVHPNWSPDGTKITFASSREDEKSLSIYVYDFKKDKLERLTYDMDCKHPCFSPDGKMIAFAGAKKEMLGYGSNIFAIDLEKKGDLIRITPIQLLGKFPMWATDEYPHWVE